LSGLKATGAECKEKTNCNAFAANELGPPWAAGFSGFRVRREKHDKNVTVDRYQGVWGDAMQNRKHEFKPWFSPINADVPRS